jgi:uncharacterized membrane protein
MVANDGSANPQPPGTSENQEHSTGAARKVWHKIRNRLLEGLLVVLPILITFWFIRWLYSGLEKFVIDPLAVLLIWKIRQLQSAPELPYWFETYVAPILAIAVALLILYCCGALAHSRWRRMVDQVFLRVPVVSHIYDAVRSVLQVLDRPAGEPTPQRVVLVPFPHPGMRLPAIVTSTCRDVTTGRVLLCVYVPTTPVPTSGFFLILPEDEATELNWDVQQTLQAIISGGLTAPPNITYYSRSVTSAGQPGAQPPSADRRA